MPRSKPTSPKLHHQSPLRHKLVGAYLAVEKGGTQLRDFSGYGNHGVLSSAGTTWGGGPRGQMVATNGSTGYIDISSVCSQIPTFGELTVLLSMRADQTTASLKAMIELQVDANNLAAIGYDAAGLIRPRVVLGGTAKTTGALSIILGQRTIVGFTVNKTNDLIRWFQDGKQIGIDVTGLGTPGSAPTTAFLGKTNAGVFAALGIDCVLIWSRALSRAAVARATFDMF